jgi:predicted house-cleaning noncanonical NTP pyrophosphatase (MazG superfamily)
MKSLLLISIITCTFLSCNQTPGNKEVTPETPKALQENSSSAEYSLLSKRGSNEDLIENLYSELVDKTPELKDIEKRIDYLNEARVDSIEDFNNFNQKNNSYYSAAEQRVSHITDSLLRDKMRSIITNSQSKYSVQIAKHNSLIEILNSKAIKLQDLHIILKLVKTLTLIEKYQKDNIPNTKPIEKVITEFDKTIQKTDSLSNR